MRRSALPGEGQLKLIQVDKRLAWLIEQLPQVALDEDLPPRQRHHAGEIPAPSRSHMQVAQQQHGDERLPDLDPHRVVAGPDEGLVAQRLLDRLAISSTDRRSRYVAPIVEMARFT